MTLLIVGMIATCVILLSYGPNQRPAAPVARHKKFYLSIYSVNVSACHARACYSAIALALCVLVGSRTSGSSLISRKCS